MRNTEFIFRRLYQMRWRLTRKGRRDIREADRAKADFAAELAAGAVNGYACLGELPHPGCFTMCPHHHECELSKVGIGDKVVVITEERE